MVNKFVQSTSGSFLSSLTQILSEICLGDHCAVWGCNDRRYLEKQNILPQVGIEILLLQYLERSSRVASLRTHVERNILKLKQFRILSGIILLLLKSMLHRITLVYAASTNLCRSSIK